MNIDFDKSNGLVPVIIQDYETKTILMLAWMNRSAYQQTIETKRVTFFSRSRNCIWVKGEQSGNFLNLIDIKADCDNDTLLVYVKPDGPVCHTGAQTCWSQDNKAKYGFISELEEIIEERKNSPSEKSYTSSLFAKGINKIAQKVGEEAIELIIEAKDDNLNLFENEAADLVFHFLVLLKAKGIKFENIVNVLKYRHLN